MLRQHIRKRTIRQTGLSMLLLTVAALVAFGPAVAQAQESTPAAAATEATTLQVMLARVPAVLPELDDYTSVLIAYADIASQLAAVGFTPPESMESDGFDQWSAATRSLMVPSPASQFLKFWREDYGFDLLQTDQTLWIALPPFDLSLYRGRFDEQAVLEALEQTGYQPIEVDGYSMLSIRGDYEQDLNASTAYKMAAMNYAAILDDGTLAFASAQEPLVAVLDVAAGQRSSLGEQSDVAALTANAPSDLAAALLVNGLALAGGPSLSLFELRPDATPDLSAIATEIAQTTEMPPVVMALLGATTGGPLLTGDGPLPLPPGIAEARAVAVLLMLSPEAAKTAAAVVEERLATESSTELEQPFADIFPERTVQMVLETPVVLVELVPAEGVRPNVLVQMLFSRDLGFLAW